MSDYERMLRGEITAREYTERVAMEARKQESLDYYRRWRRVGLWRLRRHPRQASSKQGEKK